MKKIVSIVVTFNGMSWIQKCLTSLSVSEYPTEIIVIDNGSNDGTVKLIKDNFPNVELIQVGKNLGFGQANNKGFALALTRKPDFLFLLNQDAWVLPDSLGNLVKLWLAHPEFGIISPVHLNGTGTNLDQNFLHYVLESNIKDYANTALMGNQHPHQYIETKFVNAAAWLLHVDSLHTVGGFDPMFFHYGEDTNFAHRAEFHKVKIGIVLDSFIYHDRETRPVQDIRRQQRNEWTHFLCHACNIQVENYKWFIGRRIFSSFGRSCVSLLSGNRNLAKYQFQMAIKIIRNARRISNSRRKAMTPNLYNYL